MKTKQSQSPQASIEDILRPPPLLTVTLTAKASASVRDFCTQFGETFGDTVNGVVMDMIPEALESRARHMDKAPDDGWERARDAVQEARIVRRARTPSGGPAAKVLMEFEVDSAMHSAFLVMLAEDDQTVDEWFNDTLRDQIRCFREAIAVEARREVKELV